MSITACNHGCMQPRRLPSCTHVARDRVGRRPQLPAGGAHPVERAAARIPIGLLLAPQGVQQRLPGRPGQAQQRRGSGGISHAAGCWARRHRGGGAVGPVRPHAREARRGRQRPAAPSAAVWQDSRGARVPFTTCKQGLIMLLSYSLAQATVGDCLANSKTAACTRRHRVERCTRTKGLLGALYVCSNVFGC